MLLQLTGALLILAAFMSAQVGAVDPRARSYLALNLAGSAILGVRRAPRRGMGLLRPRARLGDRVRVGSRAGPARAHADHRAPLDGRFHVA